MRNQRPSLRLFSLELWLSVTMFVIPGFARGLSAEDVKPVAPEKLEREIEGDAETPDGAVAREPLERDLDRAGGEADAEAEGVVEMLLGGFNLAQPAEEFGNVPANLRPFMPALKQALTIEIHYLRKVCDPDEKELKQIRAAGEKKIVELAKLVAKNQHQPFLNQKKGGRVLLQDSLLASAKQVLPAEKYESYRKELDARQASRLRGACEMMTFNADNTLSFPLDDYHKVVQLLTENPRPEWNRTMRTMRVFFYRDYSPLPPLDLIKPVLNERQQKIWSGKQNRNSSINFGWPANIGVQQMGLQVKLKELDDYSREVNDE